MVRIQNVSAMADYRLEVLLENGSSIILNMEDRLGSARFSKLRDREVFNTVNTDGYFIRWDNNIEISVNEVFQLAQK